MEQRKKLTKLAVALIACTFVFPSYAASHKYKGYKGYKGYKDYHEKSWRPVVALGLGASVATSIGKSQNFPIIDPISDEYFLYSSGGSSRVAALFDGFAGVEWNYRPKWKIQVGVDYNQSSSFSTSGNFIQGADVISQDNYTYHYNVITRQILAAGKLLYTFKHIYHPYLFAGVGASFNKAYNYTTNVPPFLTFTRMYSDHTNTSFSYAAGFGVDVDVTRKIRAGIGYRFADLGRADLGNPNIDGISVPGALSQSHIYTNEVLAQVTWLL